MTDITEQKGIHPMTQTVEDLIARWNSDEGSPFKGSLIDWAAYEAAPDSLGCMCAQGQVLHTVGGWTPDRLRSTTQRNADIETAKLLNISRAHAILLRHINDSVEGAPAIALTDPEKVLGGEWSELLDFWWHMHMLNQAGWQEVAAKRRAVWDAAMDATVGAARNAARNAAMDAAMDATVDATVGAVLNAARNAAMDAAMDAVLNAVWGAVWGAARNAVRNATVDATVDAVWEIQGAHILRTAGRPFFFLPMFGFASPDEIPARPANYGKVSP